MKSDEKEKIKKKHLDVRINIRCCILGEILCMQKEK